MGYLILPSSQAILSKMGKKSKSQAPALGPINIANATKMQPIA